MKYIHLKILLYSISFLFTTNSLLAAEPDSLFQSDEVINMELRFDLSAIQDERIEKPEYHDAELIYYTPGGDTKKLLIKLMVRGHFRRNPANCVFPPLSVNFKKNEVQNTIFENQNKLKLVTPCQNEMDVIDEYLIYKMYNQVTDQSMKVRLVKILYFDTSQGKELFEKYSFFIEEKEKVAERNNAIVKDRPITPFDLDRENVKKISVFQYIIGNKDWFYTSRHNIVIMQPKDSTQLSFAVPFDFDFSGFVDASYSNPIVAEGQMLPDRRVYKGLCFTADEFKDVFDFYGKLRPVFESIINNMDLLPKRIRKENINYIDYFYTVIKQPSLIKKEFLNVCETKKLYNIPE
jgi:hypothetical protein